MPGCARILALGTDVNSRSVFWWDPRIIDPDNNAHLLAGAVGGERLWFAPEGRYHWNGKPDWIAFSNYAPSPQADPGNYTFTARDDGGTFKGVVGVTDHETRRQVHASVVKTVRFIESDGPAAEVFGIDVRTELEVEPNDDQSAMDLWSIIQLPPGCRLEVPLGTRTEPLRYSPGGNWSVRDHTVHWTFTGTEQAKFGLGTGQVTGSAVTHFEFDEAPCRTMVMSFPFSRSRTYCDYPFGIPRADQVFQAWDGFGFGEIEVHSPAAYAKADDNRTVSQYRITCI